MSATETTEARSPLLVRNSSFARVWGAQLLSQSATRMYQMGVLWWVLSRVAADERGMASGFFLVCAALPPVVCAPLIARAIARRASRGVLRASVLAAATLSLVLAGFAILAEVPTLAVYPVMLGLAACQALFDPCLTKAVPELVEDADIEDATAFEQSTFSLVGMVGALLGAMLVDHVGLTGVAMVGAVAYLGAALLLTRARFCPVTGVDGEDDASDGLARAWRLLADLPFIRLALICFAVANFFITATFLILPLYTKNVLEAPALTLGLLEGALWLGMLLGIFTGKRLPGHPGTVGAGCMALFGAALVVPGFVAARGAFLVCLVAAGWAVGVTNVVFVALFQRSVPPEAKPVFFSAMLALLGASFPVAALVFGLVGDVVSTQILCLVQAVGLLLVAAVLLLRSRSANSSPRH
ncbi:MFS transporter [Streptomyces sp. NPDC059037]|uniref:MFS transporter n=1 Tax=Streptomyces sp. NPDC059037 TaxID=3346710 RepID=UPI0036A58C97